MRAWQRLGAAPSDVAIGVGLSLLGLLAAFYQEDAGPHSALIVGVTLPVIWRRAAPTRAAAAYAGGIVLSALPDLDAYRCGVAIPAALLLLYALGVHVPLAAAPPALAAVAGGIVFLTFTDPLVNPGALLFLLPLCAGVWGAGRVVRSRTRLAAQLAARSQALAARREETARLAAEVERTRLTAQLDAAARERVAGMVALAESAERGTAAEPDRVVAAFAMLEAEGRASLNAMRDLLGALRSDAPGDRAPAPTLDRLGALLDAARAGGREVALAVEGERRPLAGGVELAAYRLVQHALDGAGDDPVTVRLRYAPTALELEVGASRPPGRDPLALVRERVTAHGGRLSVAPGQGGRTVLHVELPAAYA